MQVNIPYMEHLGDVWMSVGSATQAKKHAGQLGGSVPQIVWWRFQKKMSFKYHLKNIPPSHKRGLQIYPATITKLWEDWEDLDLWIMCWTELDLKQTKKPATAVGGL